MTNITLKQYYAGCALQGMLAHTTRYKPRAGSPANWHDAIAQEADEIAKAMLRDIDALKALDTPAPTYRHKKRGTTYTVIGTAELQASDDIIEGEPLVIYRCLETGGLWARPKTEFENGRFEELPAAQPAPPSDDVVEKVALEIVVERFMHPILEGGMEVTPEIRQGIWDASFATWKGDNDVAEIQRARYSREARAAIATIATIAAIAALRKVGE